MRARCPRDDHEQGSKSMPWSPMGQLEGDVQVLRGLGLHERYNVAHDNIGSKKVIHCIAIGTLASKQTRAERNLTIDELHGLLLHRVRILLDGAPMLSTFILAKKTFEPCFAKIREACRAQDVFGPVEETKDPGDLEPERLALAAQRWASSNIRIEQAPLWRVQLLYERATSRFAIVLHTHHVITDGRAMLEVMRVLTLPRDAPLPDRWLLAGGGTTEDRANGRCLLPPVSEQLNQHHHVSLLWVLRTILVEILMGILFSVPLMRRSAGRSALWPVTKRESKSTTPSPVVRHVDFSKATTGVNITDRLKTLAKECGLGSVNSLVQAAALVAVYALNQAQRSTGESESMYVSTDTPISIRKPAQCGLVSGNFVLQSSWSRLLTDDTRVSELAKSYYSGFQSPKQKVQAGRTFSLLPYLFPRWRNRLHTPTEDAPTPWESFLRSRELESSSYRSSFELSNLGALQGVVLDRVEELFWVQPAHLVSHAINFNVMGWQQAGKSSASASSTDTISHLVATMTFYRDAFCTRQEEEILVGIFRQTITGLAEGRIAHDATLKDASRQALQMLV